jgi:tRNA-splicing ligase RtcB
VLPFAGFADEPEVPVMNIEKVHDYLWEIPKRGGMRVPGRVYADEQMLKVIQQDKSLEQVINVAYLPGIVGYSLAMPDIHWGYGFPIGGVAATDPNEGGVISPGGVGYDINCGVRVVSSRLRVDDVKPHMKKIVDALFQAVPCGVGSAGALTRLERKELEKVVRNGARWSVDRGLGEKHHLDHIEEGGCMDGADPSVVSPRAIERGLDQLGTLGSGNHFLEVDVVDEVYNPGMAQAFGIYPGAVVFQIHCGSRGFGYQVCEDFLSVMEKAVTKYNIQLPDRQLACAPAQSPEVEKYLKAFRCAANFAFANRQAIMMLAQRAIEEALGRGPADCGWHLVYDVPHNIVKLETHQVDGKERQLYVHRKGATRALPKGHPALPQDYRPLGQPVLIPGDMGRCSFVCVGHENSLTETFASTCHGAGRVMSRNQAMKNARGRSIERELADEGIVVRSRGRTTLAEEMPEAYKDVQNVVDVLHKAGIHRRVAKLRPIGVIKG